MTQVTKYGDLFIHLKVAAKSRDTARVLWHTCFINIEVPNNKGKFSLITNLIWVIKWVANYMENDELITSSL